MSEPCLKGKIIWITGTTRGVGYDLALDFAQRGAIVIATGRRDKNPELEEKLKKHSPQSVFLKQDVKEKEDASNVSEYIEKHFGTLDVLINNAGIDPRLDIEKISQQDWEQVIDINLNGSWYCAQAALPLLKKADYASIIQVGSISAHANFAQLTPYISSKMAIEGMTRGLAKDLGVFGIRVNCLVLGAVKVAKEDTFGSPQEIEDLVNAQQCIKGRILTEDIIPVFAFFSSSQSRSITGQSIHVDLGWTH